MSRPAFNSRLNKNNVLKIFFDIFKSAGNNANETVETEYGTVLCQKDFSFGHCDLYENFMIFEMNDVMMCGGPMFEKILSLMDKFYLDQKVTMILQREHETIMSVEALRQMALRENVEFAFVSQHERAIDVAIYERQNVSKRFAYMETLEEAVQWAKKNHELSVA